MARKKTKPRPRPPTYQAALRMLMRAARRQRFGVSFGRDRFTADDRRRLRNARKQEARQWAG